MSDPNILDELSEPVNAKRSPDAPSLPRELTIRAVRNIEAERVKANIPRTRLAEMSGLSLAYLKRINQQDDPANISLGVLEALAKALGVDPLDLLKPTQDTD